MLLSTIKELFPIITDKKYISRKTLESMFNEYVKKQRRKKLSFTGVKLNEKAA